MSLACWSGQYTFATCCFGQMDCFDDTFTFEACCLAEAEAAPPEGDASRFPLGLLDPFACFGGGEAEVRRCCAEPGPGGRDVRGCAFPEGISREQCCIGYKEEHL